MVLFLSSDRQDESHLPLKKRKLFMGFQEFCQKNSRVCYILSKKKFLHFYLNTSFFHHHLHLHCKANYEDCVQVSDQEKK